MDLITGGLSLAGGLAGLFGGGGANSVQLPPQQSVNLGGITNSLNNSIPQLGNFNLGGQNFGQYAGLLQNAVNNPFAGGAQGSALQASGLGIGSSLGAIGSSNLLGGEVPGMLGAAGQIFNQGFDPQNALYNRTLGQVTDQTNASLANSGIGNTPWGQGVLGNTLGNFNIDWQNNLLGRETTAAGAAGGLINQAGNTAGQSWNLGNAGSQGIAGFGSLPWQTYNNLTQNPLALLQGGAQYGQSAGALPQQQIADYLQYLSGANSANSVANQQGQLALQQQNQGFNQNQIFGQNIGSGLQGLGNAFNIPNTFSGFGGFGGSSGQNVGGYSSTNNPMNALGFAIGGV